MAPDEWCPNANLIVPTAVTTSVVKTTPPGGVETVIGATEEGTIKVQAIDEIVTVPAGTFSCVKHEGLAIIGIDLVPATTWTSVAYSIPVKQVTVDDTGQVESTIELMSLK